MQFGLTHIYTGSGKGKTTAALGLILRGLGAGKRVCLVQFLKKGSFSEIKILQSLSDRLTQHPGKFGTLAIKQFGAGKFINPMNVSIRDRKLAKQGWQFSKEALLSEQYDLLVLDEILIALKFKLLKLEDVLELIDSKPSCLELVLTGRGAPKELIAAADLVSEIKEVKHPYRRGIAARVGIEY